MSELETDLKHVRACIVLAEAEVEAGGHPFAARLVFPDGSVFDGVNEVVTSNDPTAHGEMVLLRKAFATFDSAKIATATLYSNMEPCAMCSGAIYWAGISRVVYGCSAPRLSELSGKRLSMRCQEVLAAGTREVTVTGPLIEEEAAKAHIGFWKPGTVKGPGVYGTM